MANDDLSLYTGSMANILNVKRDLLGSEAPVFDQNGWNQSLLMDPSNLQIQKWIFAWMFVRSNYKKLMSTLKDPDENF